MGRSGRFPPPVVTAHLVQVKIHRTRRGNASRLLRMHSMKAPEGFKDQHLKELRIIPNQLSPPRRDNDIQFILWIRPQQQRCLPSCHSIRLSLLSFVILLSFFAYLSFVFHSRKHKYAISLVLKFYIKRQAPRILPRKPPDKRILPAVFPE